MTHDEPQHLGDTEMTIHERFMLRLRQTGRLWLEIVGVSVFAAIGVGLERGMPTWAAIALLALGLGLIRLAHGVRLLWSGEREGEVR